MSDTFTKQRDWGTGTFQWGLSTSDDARLCWSQDPCTEEQKKVNELLKTYQVTNACADSDLGNQLQVARLSAEEWTLLAPFEAEPKDLVHTINGVLYGHDELYNTLDPYVYTKLTGEKWSEA
jgi:hypothetical protein